MEQRLLTASKGIRIYIRYLCILHCHFQKAEKKILFFTLSLQLVFFTIQAQTSNSRWKENYDIHKFRIALIDIAAKSTILQLKNINGIKVIDARADTSSVGFMQKKIIDPIFGNTDRSVRNQTEQKINTRPTFVMLGAGLQKEAGNYLTHSIQFSGNPSQPNILMVIKKLWLSDELNLAGHTAQIDKFGVNEYKDEWTSGIDVKIEFYLENAENYYALYRYDSTISEAVTVSEYGRQFIELALQLALEKMKKMDDKIANISEKRKFTIAEINQHNENEFNVPALTDSLLKAGVYMTFDEFKNNNPSQTDYEIKKDKLTDIIYIKQSNGTEYTTREIWGYSDGKNAYIKSANNFFLLQRYVHAFYVYGAKRLITEDNSAPAMAPMYTPGIGPGGSGGYWTSTPSSSSGYFIAPKRIVQLQPFLLDWTTGKLY